VKAFKILTDQELEPHHATVRQEQAAEINPVVVAEIEIGEGVTQSATDLADEMPGRTKALTLRSAQSGALKKLSENPDIAQWVMVGRAGRVGVVLLNVEAAAVVEEPVEHMRRLGRRGRNQLVVEGRVLIGDPGVDLLPGVGAVLGVDRARGAAATAAEELTV
jgi:hypothetical protein